MHYSMVECREQLSALFSPILELKNFICYLISILCAVSNVVTIISKIFNYSFTNFNFFFSFSKFLN